VSFDRADGLERLATEELDLLVVGGGITGAGVALDAASRGLRVGLVERRDWASGTSSKSSKLVHGGLRYLQQREFRLVYEALAERQRLRRTAPHLVRLLPFLIPMFGKGGVIHPKLRKTLNSALWMYDLTGGARIGKVHEQISAEETLAHMPTLRAGNVVGGFVYYDAQTDDARLTMTIARTAAEHGAACATWTSVVALTKDGAGTVSGARLRTAEGDELDVRARTVVNATGVWSDDIRTLDEGVDPRAIRPAKGIHVTVPWEKVRNDIAAVVPVPKDKRSIFVVPLGGHTYIGTTDTDYDGPVDDPVCTRDDVDYLLHAMNAALTSPLAHDDVVATWAGLRPLVRSATTTRTADLSRRHSVVASDSGVITVNGGKLTTYRKMAEDTVDVVMEQLGRKGRSITKKITLHGADGADRVEDLSSLRRHGSDVRIVRALVDADAALGEPLVAGLPFLRAEAVHAVRHEMARTLDDVLTRRVPARWLAGDAAADAAEATARLIAPDLGWGDDEIQRQVAAFRDAVAADRSAVLA
jgi:glycerol-3-phosphate dehydrogenase